MFIANIGKEKVELYDIFCSYNNNYVHNYTRNNIIIMRGMYLDNYDLMLRHLAVPRKIEAVRTHWTKQSLIARA